MIEATCTACGNVSRLSEADVPLGAKFITCTACKARVALPAAKATPPPIPPPLAKTQSGMGADLPAPKRGSIPDIPKPARPGMAEADLPAPKATRAPPTPTGSFELDLGTDLPVPKGTPLELADLPEPKVGGGREADLPAPKRSTNAFAMPPPVAAPPPAPAAAAPAGTLDLPAPKGFFDDLPQPVRANPELPAPKGFFDDLPQRAQSRTAPELPAPKGFFDDLPGRTSKDKPALPAPKGFFEDLPGKVSNDKPAPPAPKGFYDDLPQRGRPSTAPPNQSNDLALAAAPDLDLRLEEPEAQSNQFADLDLQRPTATRASNTAPPPGMRLETPKRSVEHRPLEPLAAAAPAGTDLALELEEPRRAPGTRKLGSKPQRPTKEKAAGGTVRKAVFATLAVAALGGGGFIGYRRFFAKSSVDVEAELVKARAAIAAADGEHWDRAAKAARAVLEVDSKNAEALAIAAEALCADALATGIAADNKTVACRRYINSANTDNIAHARLPRATALSATLSGADGDLESSRKAVERLTPIADQAPTELALQLYLGWALAASGDYPAAVKAFDKASAGTDAIKLHALYGRAQAKLAQIDLAGARADFNAVFQLDKNHIGAQVGLAASLPAEQSQQQEQELKAILERKDLATADPRAVVMAWLMAADSAKRASRLDVARERYQKALALRATDVRALAGLAEVEMIDGKLDAAATQVGKALALAKDDVRAQLIQTEISLLQKNLSDAATRLGMLAARNPPPSKSDLARIQLVTGKLYDAQNEDERALEAYKSAAKLAGDSDLAPTLAAVNKLVALAAAASRAKNEDRATELRSQADELLARLETNAEKDPQVALTLGVAYLRAGDAKKAEPWLRKVIDARPDDPEGHFQLGKALRVLGNFEEAVHELQIAIKDAPTRVELSIELALTYEADGLDREAGETYASLLAREKAPTTELRARAGRFYARTGNIVKAAEQGEAILAVEPRNASGFYLKAEGQLAQDRAEDARQLLTRALEVERSPHFLDALGRACEVLARKDNDTRFLETAMKSYNEAIQLDSKLWSPRFRLGRLQVERNDLVNGMQTLKSAWDLKRTAEVAMLIGSAAKEANDTKRAIEWLRESIKIEPSAEASWLLGQLYTLTNAGKEAAQQLDAAVEAARLKAAKTGVQPEWLAEAVYLQGKVHYDNGNYPAAKRAWQLFLAMPHKDNARIAGQVRLVRSKLATTLRDVK